VTEVVPIIDYPYVAQISSETASRDSIYAWIYDNITSDFMVNWAHTTYHFKNEDDAVFVKLKYSGTT